MTPGASGPRARRAAFALGGAIALAAAVPRLLGLDVGGVLAAAHLDELPVAVAQWKLDQHAPSSFLVAYGGGYHVPLQLALDVLRALGFDTALDILPQLSQETLQRFLLPLRAYSALVATAAVALVFAAGRALAGNTGGAVAALVLAAAPAAIRDAHLAKADAAATLAAALVIAAIAHPFARSRTRAIALGVACGVALSTKYMVGLAPAAALAAWRDPEPARCWGLDRLALFAAVTAATALALNWFWLAHARECWTLWVEVLGSQYLYVRSPWMERALRPPLEYHALVSLRYGCGLLSALLAAPAIGAALARAGAARWIAVAVLGQLAVLLHNPLTLSRNFSALIPGIALAIGCLVARGLERAPERARRPALALCLALLAAPGWDGLRMALVMRELDTRALAQRWIEANAPLDARIAGFGGPPKNDWGLPDVGPRKLVLGLDPAHWGRAADLVVRYRYPLPVASEELPAEPALGAPLAVFDPFAEGADPVVEPLDVFYLPLARFAGVERPGPRIEIYSSPKQEP